MKVSETCRWTSVALSIVLLGLIVWTPAPAFAGEEPGRCLALQKDLTDPALREILQQRTVIPASGVRTVFLSSGKKISQQTFIVGDGSHKMAQTTTTCTGTCTGGCGVSGCDVTSSLGCSSCNCTGGACTGCTCTKTSTYTPKE
ncbi:MAG: hypothetical protein ACJ75H_03760 [Thermoanaerobaculia bacterium]